MGTDCRSFCYHAEKIVQIVRDIAGHYSRLFLSVTELSIGYSAANSEILFPMYSVDDNRFDAIAIVNVLGVDYHVSGIGILSSSLFAENSLAHVKDVNENELEWYVDRSLIVRQNEAVSFADGTGRWGCRYHSAAMKRQNSSLPPFAMLCFDERIYDFSLIANKPNEHDSYIFLSRYYRSGFEKAEFVTPAIEPLRSRGKSYYNRVAWAEIDGIKEYFYTARDGLGDRIFYLGSEENLNTQWPLVSMRIIAAGDIARLFKTGTDKNIEISFDPFNFDPLRPVRGRHWKLFNYGAKKEYGVTEEGVDLPFYRDICDYLREGDEDRPLSDAWTSVWNFINIIRSRKTQRALFTHQACLEHRRRYSDK